MCISNENISILTTLNTVCDLHVTSHKHFHTFCDVNGTKGTYDVQNISIECKRN